MTVWCHLPTIFNQRHALRIAGLLSLCVALTTTLLFANVSRAVPSTDRTLNFQGRLLNSSGAVVADGYYNVQFKIYEGGTGTAAGNPSGTLKWTETYINNGNASGAIQVKNGYFAANLGSVNSFGTSVDWDNSTLWLSVNVAGSSVSCTTFGSAPCAADGEMLPMKRITATPYAINSGQLGGKTADNFVQLGQGVQEDVTYNTSIAINKTGVGNFLELQNSSVNVLTVEQDGDVIFGGKSNQNIVVGEADANSNGGNLNVQAGTGGSSEGTAGGTLTLQGGTSSATNGHGGWVSINAGTATGTGNAGKVLIGEYETGEVRVGSMSEARNQTINIGANDTAGSTTNVTIGAGGNANGGSTSIRSKDDTTIETNGTQRARFSGSGNTLYVGNADTSGNAITANSFTIQGTSSTGSNVQGGSLALQAGSATSGNANGGDLTLGGGAGVGTGSEGLIVLNSPTAMQTATVQTCSTNCTITQANVDGNGVVGVNASGAGVTFTLNAPTNTTAGRIVYVMAASGSNDFTLSVNGGGAGNLTSMRQNTTATMVWSGSAWTVAGASNSTTLQSAYDNTLQSAGGAELIVSSGTNANGLTIRDSSSNPVNGTLLEVQNASASTLFSVNSNVPEYATNGGAETAGSSASQFPANTWSAYNTGASTVTRHTIPGDYIATGQASTKVVTTGFLSGVKNQLSTTLTPNMKYNVSFGARLENGTFNDMTIAYASDGSSASATCSWSNVGITKSAWKKVNCSFTTPSSGLSSANSIIIGQIGNESRTYYIDNLSVTIAGNQNYATDGTVNTQASFDNGFWSTTGTGSTVQRVTDDGQEKSDSAEVTTTAGGTNRGIRNQLSIKPLPNTLYRISVYAKSSNTFNDFSIRYTLDGTNFVECADYAPSQTVETTWTEISCYIKTTSATSGTPYIHFVQAGSAARVFKIDGFEMNLATNTAANVQVGGGSNGGQTTLFTLDQGGSAPIADNTDALLGSMYYDTSLGKIQCYEADGWGACGSSPDNIITISPEYTNAVMHGTGVGTMTSDFCSSSLSINDGTNGQPAICGSGQTYNLYKWTSPQTSSQTYSIYVTYQLPSTFKSFASGSTSIKGRTDNGSNGGSAAVQYTVMRNNGSGLTPCSSAVSVSSGTQTSWQPGQATGNADPSTCGFAAGDSVVFKIDMTASKNAIAYVSNLGFTFSNN
jgi:hypothetical protein